MKDNNLDFNAFFLRRFPKFKELEKRCNELEVLVRGFKREKAELQRKVVSDSNLIESLQRYIGALEGKAAMQAELIQELKEHLSGILPNKTEAANE